MNRTNRRRLNFFGGVKWNTRHYLNMVNSACTKFEERYPGPSTAKGEEGYPDFSIIRKPC